MQHINVRVLRFSLVIGIALILAGCAAQTATPPDPAALQAAAAPMPGINIAMDHSGS